VSPASVTVRAALPQEHEAAGEVAGRAYAEGTPEHSEERGYSQVVRATVAAPDPGPVLVALREGRVVGTATLCPPGTRNSELARPGEMEFRFLAVDPAHQGTGVAPALLEAVLDHARAAGAERAVCFVIDWNESAHRLYRGRGFTRMPDRDWRPIPDVLLQAYALPLA